MARKQPARLAPAPTPEPERGGAQPAPDPMSAVRAHIDQSQPALAAAALLPVLDAAAASGDEPSRLAAVLLRTGLSAPGANAAAPPVPQAVLAAATEQLTALLRRQDDQLVRLQEMLDGVL